MGEGVRGGLGGGGEVHGGVGESRRGGVECLKMAWELSTSMRIWCAPHSLIETTFQPQMRISRFFNKPSTYRNERWSKTRMPPIYIYI